jgi:hypothetical protein
MTNTLCKTPLAIAGFLAAALCADTSRAQGTWSAGTPFPTTVTRAAGVWFAPNSHFYAVGGRATDSAGSELMNPYEYDPVAAMDRAAGAFPDNRTATWSRVCCRRRHALSGIRLRGRCDDRRPPCGGTTGDRRIIVVATDPWSGAPAYAPRWRRRLRQQTLRPRRVHGHTG